MYSLLYFSSMPKQKQNTIVIKAIKIHRMRKLAARVIIKLEYQYCASSQLY